VLNESVSDVSHNDAVDAEAQEKPVSKKGSFCDVCNKLLPNKRSVLGHMRPAHNSAGEKSVMETFGRTAQSCTVCGKRFYTLQSLNMHQNKSHGKTVASEEVSEGTSKKLSETGAFCDAYEHAGLPSLMQQDSEEGNVFHRPTVETERDRCMLILVKICQEE